MSSEPSSATTTTFAELLARVPTTLESGSPVSLEIPPGWGQGRATFGGVLTGLGLRAMAGLVPGEAAAEPGAGTRRCRSMLVSFAGPVAPGPLELTATRVRHGRSATQTSATLVQDKTLRCAIMASFASDRESAIVVPGAPRPELAGPEGLSSMPVLAGLIPEFAQHFELRWASGGPPGSGLRAAEFGGWVRLREHARGLGPAWIAALVDAWPAPVLQTLKVPAAASSLSWAIDFVAVDEQAASDDWWAFAVATERAQGGWAHTRARLWSPAGILVATSAQTVAVFG